ncbi:hypothetical protein [Microbacterium sp. T32]|uniref:hypothetical protein n=1 Tax=Microbacterium sp. T32 TaxID=1776083 RepID=UPI0007ABACE6|nr:hypothetical protein [Microbacterium sp. T32]KZE41438.1 hypothetical protein AVW09_02280 [Microbacterium sp. T32]
MAPALLPLTDPAEWPESAVAVIRKELRGAIDIVIPGEPGSWNPDTDRVEGGTADTVLVYDRRARIRELSAREIASSSDSRGVGTHRVTIEMEAGDHLIPDEGAVVVVRNGGRSQKLTGERLPITWVTASTDNAPFLFITVKYG